MKTSFRVHEAQRIFLLTLMAKMAFGMVGLMITMGPIGSTWRLALVPRAIPMTLLAIIVFPSWFGRGSAKRQLAIGLTLDVLIESLSSASMFFDVSNLIPEGLSLPEPLASYVGQSRMVEPFFFLLIPLILAAWAYGRKGAILFSSWASFLHITTGIWARHQDILAKGFVFGAVVRITLLYFVPYLVALLAERERKQHDELAEAHARLRRHADTVEQLAISQERNRLARDLHDTLAHSLAALTVQLEALRTLQDHDPALAKEATDQAAALAKRGLAESRQAIQALRSDTIETQGLVGALRSAAQDFQSRSGIVCTFSTAGDELELSPDEAQVFFRVAEEALYNIERHARAKNVTLRLSMGQDTTALYLRDDGVGFDPASVQEDRYGLVGMRERAAMISAEFKILSQPGRGTEIWLTLQR